MDSRVENRLDRKVPAPRLERGSRSFAAMTDIYQEMTRIAAKVGAAYKLYQKPLLTPAETLLLIQNAWNKAQYGNRSLEKLREVDTYVSIEKSDWLRRIANASSLKVSIVEQVVI